MLVKIKCKGIVVLIQNHCLISVDQREYLRKSAGKKKGNLPQHRQLNFTAASKFHLSKGKPTKGVYLCLNLCLWMR